jgi:hypothetical protein
MAGAAAWLSGGLLVELLNLASEAENAAVWLAELAEDTELAAELAAVAALEVALLKLEFNPPSVGVVKVIRALL